MAKPYRRPGSKFWYIAPMINGVQVPQSSGTTVYAEALQKLRDIQGQVARGVPLKPDTGKGSFGELLKLVVTDYKMKGRASLEDLERRIDKHIQPSIGHLMAKDVQADTISQYALSLKESGASNASINRELAVIKRAFRLGIRAGKIIGQPYIEMLPEENARTGFFTEDQFRALIRHCLELLADILTVAYYTGWRIKSILRLEWRHVDFAQGFVRLDAKETKNRKAVEFPLVPELLEALRRRRSVTDQIEREKACVIPLVFHRNGKPVRSIRGAWEAARKAAGVPGRIIHDFRRTATTNLLEVADLPAVMDMVGFKSVQMVARYAKSRQAHKTEIGRKLTEKLRSKAMSTSELK